MRKIFEMNKKKHCFSRRLEKIKKNDKLAANKEVMPCIKDIVESKEQDGAIIPRILGKLRYF